MILRFAPFVALAATLLVVACGDDDTEPPTSAVTPSVDAGTTTGPGSSTADASATADAGTDADTGDAAAFTLTAPWADGAAIPVAYTCDGTNGSPLLTWSGAPAGTQSFAVVMRDVSLAQRDNYHWVIFNIPATTSSLVATLPQTTTLTDPAGARQTNWSFGATAGYGGPCPPSLHRYEITLVALSTTLATTSTDAATVDALIQAGALARVTVAGTFAPTR